MASEAPRSASTAAFALSPACSSSITESRAAVSVAEFAFDLSAFLSMELVAARRPFLYFPLAHHFEQQVHVPHRLAQYRAGLRMEYADAAPERIAEELVGALDTPVDYAPVETDGARTAARMLAELL